MMQRRRRLKHAGSAHRALSLDSSVLVSVHSTHGKPGEAIQADPPTRSFVSEAHADQVRS